MLDCQSPPTLGTHQESGEHIHAVSSCAALHHTCPPAQFCLDEFCRFTCPHSRNRRVRVSVDNYTFRQWHALIENPRPILATIPFSRDSPNEGIMKPSVEAIVVVRLVGFGVDVSIASVQLDCEG